MSGTSIPVSQASPLLTAQVVARFSDNQEIQVNTFLQSFFKDNLTKVRYPIVEIERGTEKVAIDVIHGHQGNRNETTKFTQKAWDPYYYNEYFDATTLQAYFRVFGSKAFAENDLDDLATSIDKENKKVRDMIERSKNIMCASILKTGTSKSLRNGDILDFKRKADSMVDLTAGYYWDQAGVNPITTFTTGQAFLRTEGKYGGDYIDVIFGKKAFAAIMANTEMKERWKLVTVKRDNIFQSQKKATGASYHGDLDCDTCIVRMWTYDDYYEDPTTGELVQYLDDTQIYMLGGENIGEMIHAACPQIAIPPQTSSLVTGKYILSNYANPEKKYHRFYTESSPLAAPIKIDRMYTAKVVGS
jgi:hypothetical protein